VNAVAPANPVSARGGLIWLLRHEFKLQLRESPSSRWIIWVGLAVVGLSILGATVARGLLPDTMRGLPAVLSNGALSLLSLGTLLLFNVMLSLSVRSAVQTLFERGDVDLLLSSPIDTRVVLAARGTWVFVTGFFSIAVFVVPIDIGAAIFLGPRVLGVVPLLVSLALIGAGIGLMVTLLLVRWLGARRARTVAQVVGVITGAGFYLVTQLGRFINTDTMPWLQNLSSSLNDIPADSALFIPARAGLFEPLPTLLMLVIGVAVFAGSVQVMHRAFLTGATSSVTGGRVRVAKNARPSRFQQNFFLNVLQKEWRLILRDPMLISQTLLQFVYFIPTAFIFFGGNSSRGNFMTITGIFPVLAFAATFIGGSLAQNLTQIVVSAEDAPELLGMAPANPGSIRAAKLIAAITPAWVLFVPLILWRATLEPRSLIVFLPFIAVTVLGGLMMLWSAKPFNRADLMKRRRGGQNWILGLSLLLLDAAWLAAVLAPGWWAVSAVLVGLTLPFVTWLLNRDRSRLAY
jgi:ABC-2 type transport system permease protein